MVEAETTALGLGGGALPHLDQEELVMGPPRREGGRRDAQRGREGRLPPEYLAVEGGRTLDVPT